MGEIKSFKSGFVGVVGPTNSGKSTLVNTLVGEKVSIVSNRVQTTYHGVRGILTRPEFQIVFTDTPGFQRHSESLARLLNRVADRNAKECDLLVWVFDASNPKAFSDMEGMAPKIRELKNSEQTLCVLNKVDKISKGNLLPLIERISGLAIFAEIIPLSARNGDNVDRLLSLLIPRLSEGPPLFPEDMVTDRPTQFLVSECIREKIYERTKQEIPYSVRVEIDDWNQEGETAKKVPLIHVTIHADSSSRKAILIGKRGGMLKEIGTRARSEIEKRLGHQICLKLHVDVEEEWRRDQRVVSRYLELN